MDGRMKGRVCVSPEGESTVRAGRTLALAELAPSRRVSKHLGSCARVHQDARVGDS